MLRLEETQFYINTSIQIRILYQLISHMNNLSSKLQGEINEDTDA